MPKPEVDRIDGLSPSISIQQKTGGRNPRETVGTITEINDYLRVLFARVGQGHCPNCDRPVAAQTREQIVARILDLPDGTAYQPARPGRSAARRGNTRTSSPSLLARRLRAGAGQRPGRRLDRQPRARSPDQAQHRGRHRPAQGRAQRSGRGWPRRSRRRSSSARGRSSSRPRGTSRDLLLSSHYACAACGLSFDPPSPQLFSFNSPQGMCPACDGLGVRHDFDPDAARARPDRCRSGTGRSSRSGRSRRSASGGGTCSRGSPPTSRPTPTARPKGRC